MEWRKIIDGKITDSGSIKKAIENLEDQDAQLENDITNFKESISKCQLDLLSNDETASDKITIYEKRMVDAISKRKAIINVLIDLNRKLKNALIDEKSNRIKEIFSEVNKIEEERTISNLKILEDFAKAAAKFEMVTGRASHELSYSYFENHGLDKQLTQAVEDHKKPGQTLSLRRQFLLNERTKLEKELQAE
ncbi:MAG: hypothetical protein K8S18_03105 [Desulfobacula sp.]|nr:hypothetical protein [Desulfobacula sp.]